MTHRQTTSCKKIHGWVGGYWQEVNEKKAKNMEQFFQIGGRIPLD